MQQDPPLLACPTVSTHSVTDAVKTAPSLTVPSQALKPARDVIRWLVVALPEPDGVLFFKDVIPIGPLPP